MESPKTKLNSIIQKVEPEHISTVASYISGILGLQFDRAFRTINNLSSEQYFALSAIAIDYITKEPEEVEETINKELNNKVINNEIIRKFVPQLVVNIEERRSIENAHNADALIGALEDYIKSFNKRMGFNVKSEGLEIYIADTLEEFIRKRIEKDLKRDPKPEPEGAKIFDFKTGERIWDVNKFLKKNK